VIPRLMGGYALADHIIEVIRRGMRS